MARYQYVVLACAVEGQEQAFDEWYDGQHLQDVLRVPGVLTGKRFNVAFQKVYDIDAPRYHSMTVYEIETDDPAEFLAKLSAMHGTPEMPSNSALTKKGMLQVVGLMPLD